MEPQIIDHYNAMPSGINVIDKMNDELYELQEKYEELLPFKKKYEKLKMKNLKPSILFNSIEHFNKVHDNMFTEIQHVCNQWVNDVPKNCFYNWAYGAIYNITQPDIIQCIFKELYKITNDNNFSWTTAYGSVTPITSLFRDDTPYWISIYNSLTKSELQDLLYDSIKYHLDNQKKEYSVFKCYKCEKIIDHINDENMCYNCYGYSSDVDSVE